MRRWLLALACLLAIAAILIGLREPRLDRDWDEDVAVLAAVEISADESRFSLQRVRNWRYDATAVRSKNHFDASYALADLSGITWYEQILDERGLIAHTFVVFEFNGPYAHPRIGVSVETRREIGEQYSLFKGVLRGFELTHTWASATDLIERRVKFLGYELTEHRVTQTLAYQRQYLLAFLRETQALAKEPRWYNTITSNCTNVIINAANALNPGYLPFDKAFIFTGLADDYLIERGVLDANRAKNINPSNLGDFVLPTTP